MADIKTLNDFFNTLKSEPVRLQNQFQVFVNSGHADVDRALNNLTIWASTANLPGRQQNVAPLQYMGYEFNVPTSMAMTNSLDLSIRSDQNMLIRNAFLRWMSYISNPDIEGGSNTEGDKRIPGNSNIRLRLLNDRFDKDIAVYKLAGCIITDVGAMELSNAAADIATFSVAVKYQYWKMEKNDGGNFPNIR